MPAMQSCISIISKNESFRHDFSTLFLCTRRGRWSADYFTC
uniref:Uncharacterized protein n=1 Tax=Anguilla anguilla TaxID=7936 RepID=A0A0E9TFJ6_ANGAN